MASDFSSLIFSYLRHFFPAYYSHPADHTGFLFQCQINICAFQPYGCAAAGFIGVGMSQKPFVYCSEVVVFLVAGAACRKIKVGALGGGRPSCGSLLPDLRGRERSEGW